MNSRRLTASAYRASEEKDTIALLRCRISIWPMRALGHSRTWWVLFGDVRFSPESGHQMVGCNVRQVPESDIARLLEMKEAANW